MRVACLLCVCAVMAMAQDGDGDGMHVRKHGSVDHSCDAATKVIERGATMKCKPIALHGDDRSFDECMRDCVDVVETSIRTLASRAGARGAALLKTISKCQPQWT
jgi:hypothetical protein